MTIKLEPHDNRDGVKARVICLMGATATGKTALAIELASRQPVDIISVDSAMVYKGLNIGTGKPTTAELKQAPHHLIDLNDPLTPYSAAQFVTDAKKIIANSIANNRIPLLVGGTMLYFKALQQGLALMPQANQQIRAQLLAEATESGWEKLHQQLQQIDPITAAKIKPSDRQRIQRALEVYRITGRTMADFIAQQHREAKTSEYDFINIGLNVDRALLHQNIAKRLDNMLSVGFIEEVAELQQRGDLTADLPAIRSVGYRQIWSYLSGNCNKQQMYDNALAATRQLAKRQITWLRSWPELQLLELNEKLQNNYLACCKLMLD